jgi:UDP-GlcNAc:undecaprenyl-phosphate GlcNAc-1-phosphate transferase
MARPTVVCAFAARFGPVDCPDGTRKIHGKETPVAGGIALLMSLFGTLLVSLWAPGPANGWFAQQGLFLPGLLLASLVIGIVGLVDDSRGLRARHKLLGQLCAVAIVMASGLTARSIQLFDWHLELGLLALPFTAFWLLATINSLNLLDGMDGLLSCVGLIISLAMAAMAILGNQWVAASVAAALAGALLGFLRYNFPPASIFLGDSGSMLIGLIVGAVALRGSLKGPATVALAAPLAILAIPEFDHRGHHPPQTDGTQNSLGGPRPGQWLRHCAGRFLSSCCLRRGHRVMATGGILVPIGGTTRSSCGCMRSSMRTRPLNQRRDGSSAGSHLRYLSAR